jgi:hypothetical protein
MSNINININKLFIKYCPIFYFNKKDPYMPINFDDLLKNSLLTPVSVLDTNLKFIKILNKKQTHPMATQILCKTSNFFTVNKINYIDLIYITVFSWNGTLHEHAFDKEEVIIRLLVSNNETFIIRVFGSSHGNGMWFNIEQLDFENDKVIMYSANESHAMYNKPRTYKRMFGFGNDITSKDIKWEPSQFVIFSNENNVIILNKDETQINGNFDYFSVNKYIGDEQDNQLWAGAIEYDTINLDGFYKFQGGIDNLFTGDNKFLSNNIRLIIRIIVVLIWVLFLIYIIFKDIINYNNHIYTHKKLILYNILHVFMILVLFLSGTILGLDIFILNPIK